MFVVGGSVAGAVVVARVFVVSVVGGVVDFAALNVGVAACVGAVCVAFVALLCVVDVVVFVACWFRVVVVVCFCCCCCC